MSRGGPPQDGPLAGHSPSLAGKMKKLLATFAREQVASKDREQNDQETKGFIRYFDRGEGREHKLSRNVRFYKVFCSRPKVASKARGQKDHETTGFIRYFDRGRGREQKVSRNDRFYKVFCSRPEVASKRAKKRQVL